MNELAKSYQACYSIAKKSGSSFFRSFGLLSQPRRDAMMALYAFARLADDATDADADAYDGSQSNPNQNAMGTGHAWNASRWHQWIDQLSNHRNPPPDESVSRSSLPCLESIRLALRDSVQQFVIPGSALHDIVSGVDIDTVGPVRLDSWEETQEYCYLVASSVGVACLAIWAKTIGAPPSENTHQAALDCGVAFQLTNILRDLTEDARRGRIYLPQQDLDHFGISTERWLKMGQQPSVFALNELGDWRGLIRLYVERAHAHYELGWRVAGEIALDGQRMFSLMWHTYRELLLQIEQAPECIWQGRIGITTARKGQLLANHIATPLFQKQLAYNAPLLTKPVTVKRNPWPKDGLRVAVIGAGLAGINAAMHLARNGAQVTLIESKNRIGGRVGSFIDSSSGQAVDYCQHVGMYCCKALQQWLQDTDQKSLWNEQDSLHFASSHGKRIEIKSWNLPAPFHLSGLLWKWPGLKLADRVRVAGGLLKLLRLKKSEEHSSVLAIDWLKEAGQTEACIKNFWATILVSALGEQVERVTLGATHKVLVDGFAANRRAYHLLVPNRPLSEIMDDRVTQSLQAQGITLSLGDSVKSMKRDNQGLFRLSHLADPTNASNNPPPSWSDVKFDSVLCAVPWHTVESILPESMRQPLSNAGRSPSLMDSSPITGIHTWWDRPWLQEPHAILIDRLCQWVFPAPESALRSHRSSETHATSDAAPTEHYYQIVISGSRMLPRGDAEGVLKIVKQDLAEIFPESAVATMFRGKVVTDPNAVFSVSPGHESSRLTANEFAEQGIWLAGDWTQTFWPATMEGALLSGAKSAEGILTTFSRPTKLS
jgi:squalene-associated FAD-dependent desaturase